MSTTAIHQYYRGLLGQWPVASQQLTVPTRLGETFLIASGPAEAPPLVLLHGSSATSGMWLGDVASYAESHRVYAVDIPGEPGLSDPARPPLASSAYADGWPMCSMRSASRECDLSASRSAGGSRPTSRPVGPTA